MISRWLSHADQAGWRLRTVAGQQLPLHLPDEAAWPLVAKAADRRLPCSVEWNGETLRPLSVWTQRSGLAGKGGCDTNLPQRTFHPGLIGVERRQPTLPMSGRLANC
ncbi:MAG: hypothetical protein IPL59_24975 [Candidatus Competibacteraceae bacterium]|nr:hypothetical protein [Candidatus Competibacteraceae bacterium]